MSSSVEGHPSQISLPFMILCHFERLFPILLLANPEIHKTDTQHMWPGEEGLALADPPLQPKGMGLSSVE